MNKINECVKCGSLNLYFLPDNSALCIDCRAISNFIVEIDKVDALSYWIWKRDYMKMKKYSIPLSPENKSFHICKLPLRTIRNRKKVK